MTKCAWYTQHLHKMWRIHLNINQYFKFWVFRDIFGWFIVYYISNNFGVIQKFTAGCQFCWFCSYLACSLKKHILIYDLNCKRIPHFTWGNWLYVFLRKFVLYWKSFMEIEFWNIFPSIPVLNLLIQEKLSTKACSVFQFAGFKVVSNLLKDMYTILDEVHTMSLEVNILQHKIGIVGVLPKRGTENGKSSLMLFTW